MPGKATERNIIANASILGEVEQKGVIYYLVRGYPRGKWSNTLKATLIEKKRFDFERQEGRYLKMGEIPYQKEDGTYAVRFPNTKTLDEADIPTGAELKQKYKELGTQKKVAEHYNITIHTLRKWSKIRGVKLAPSKKRKRINWDHYFRLAERCY